MNEDASLQYQNIFKETYIIIIDEPKQAFIDVFREMGEYDDSLSAVKNYRDIQIGFFSTSMNMSNQSEAKSLKIGGLDVEINCFVYGVDQEIVYYLTFVEGRKNLYMIMAWTLKDRKIKYEPTFQKMAKSFRLN